MREVNLFSVGGERFSIRESHARRLVEALVRGVRHDIWKKRDLQSAPMGDKVHHGLREKLPALAHVMEDRRVLGHGVEKIREFQIFVRRDPKTVVEQQHIVQKAIGGASVVIDIFEARRRHDEFGLARLQPSEDRREVLKQNHVDIDIRHFVERERQRLELSQAPTIIVEHAGVKLAREPIDLGWLLLDEMRAVYLRRAAGLRDIVVIGDEIQRQGGVRGAIALQKRQQPVDDLVVADDGDAVAPAGGRGVVGGRKSWIWRGWDHIPRSTWKVRRLARGVVLGSGEF